jgi:hypothetical protein
VVLGQQDWASLKPSVDLVVKAVNGAGRGRYAEVLIPGDGPVLQVEL